MQSCIFNDYFLLFDQVGIREDQERKNYIFVWVFICFKVLKRICYARK